MRGKLWQSQQTIARFLSKISTRQFPKKIKILKYNKHEKKSINHFTILKARGCGKQGAKGGQNETKNKTKFM
jgi:ribosomal protein L33